jgi:hypothetical protein
MSKSKKSRKAPDVYSVEQFHAAEQAGTPLPDDARVVWSLPGGGGAAAKVGLYRNIIAHGTWTVESFTVGRRVVEQSSDGQWHVELGGDDEGSCFTFDTKAEALEYVLDDETAPTAFAN